MAFKIADVPVNVIDGFEKFPKVFVGVALVAFGLGLSSAFNQDADGILAMSAVLLIEICVAWYIGRPK